MGPKDEKKVRAPKPLLTEAELEQARRDEEDSLSRPIGGTEAYSRNFVCPRCGNRWTGTGVCPDCGTAAVPA